MENNTTISNQNIELLLRQLLLEQKKTQELVTEESNKGIENVIAQTKESKQSILDELHQLKKQNVKLEAILADIKTHNLLLREELRKNTSDRILKIIGILFFLLFASSIIFYVFFNYELVKFNWSKIGVLISIGVFLIGHFVSKMFKNHFIQNTNGDY